jgi:hypothetical protein
MRKRQITLLKGVVFLILALGIVCSAERANAKVDYLDLVQSYADAMIKHGRDVYGPDKTPLFAGALDRRTLTLMNTAESIKGIREVDRAITGANPMHDQNFYQILYALTEVTGKKRYAKEADKSLKWFLENCQSPATGLLAWGEHMGWDFNAESIGKGKKQGTHEFYRPWVLWERCNILAPKACAIYARGLWDHQIHEHSGNFSRHAQWAEHGTGPNSNYPRHSGFYITAWADAYNRSKDPVFLKAIETVVDFIENRRNQITGALPCQSGKSRIKIIWPESNLSLAVDLWEGAKKVPEDLARKMRFCASKSDQVYLRIKHDFSPNGVGFISGCNADTLEPLTDGPWTNTDIWVTGYGKYTDAQDAMMCYERYRQVGLEGYKKLILAASARYLDSELDESETIYPGVLGDVIYLMLVAHELSGDAKYLKRADYFADKATKLFFDSDSPLPKASSIHQHYEAITRSDTLMMALLRLWAVHNQPGKELSLVYSDR